MYERLLRQPFMSRTGVVACDAEALVAAMCEFERALARVEERAGLLPAGTATTIADQLRVTAFDIDAIAAAAADGGNAAIPFVAQARAMLPAEARAGLHRGATSQDVIDSALMLLLKPRLAHCCERLDSAISAGGVLMQNHVDTPLAGRTLTQQALPLTFGAVVARWLAALLTTEQRLQAVHERGLFVQFGGPVGAHHGVADGPGLMASLAAELGLACPLLPWHTDRQPVLALIDAVGAMAVAAEKIATDVAFMARTEVAEVREPPTTGSGGSSSMPHKANPVGSTRIRAAARQIHAAVTTLHHAGAQPQERAFGEWHAEWAPLVDAVLLLEGALDTLADLLAGLQVDTAAMRANLDAVHGANLHAPAAALLSEVMDAQRADELAAQGSRVARARHCDYPQALLSLAEVAAHFDDGQLRAALDPGAHVGASRAQVARVAGLLAQRSRSR